MWYLYIAAVVGVIFEVARPAKYDDIGLWARIMVPAVAGLLWPILLVWLIVLLIRNRR